MSARASGEEYVARAPPYRVVVKDFRGPMSYPTGGFMASAGELSRVVWADAKLKPLQAATSSPMTTLRAHVGSAGSGNIVTIQIVTSSGEMPNLAQCSGLIISTIWVGH